MTKILPAHLADEDIQLLTEMIMPVVVASVLDSELFRKLRATSIAAYLWEHPSSDDDYLQAMRLIHGRDSTRIEYIKNKTEEVLKWLP